MSITQKQHDVIAEALRTRVGTWVSRASLTDGDLGDLLQALDTCVERPLVESPNDVAADALREGRVQEALRLVAVDRTSVLLGDGCAEVGCDEPGSWVTMWAFDDHRANGNTIISSRAFCAEHIYDEVLRDARRFKLSFTTPNYMAYCRMGTKP